MEDVHKYLQKLYALDANVCVGARNNDARSTANAFGYSSISLNQLDENFYNLIIFLTPYQSVF